MAKVWGRPHGLARTRSGWVIAVEPPVLRHYSIRGPCGPVTDRATDPQAVGDLGEAEIMAAKVHGEAAAGLTDQGLRLPPDALSLEAIETLGLDLGLSPCRGRPR